MNLTRATASLLAILLWTFLPTAAESPVNFSGTWELDKSRSVLPSRAPSALPGDVMLVIDHAGDTVKIERRVKLMAVHRSLASTYYTDGRETSNPSPRGDMVMSRSHWTGKVLVTERWGQLKRMETTDVMQLSEDGKVLVIDSTIRLAGQDSPERSHLVFVKK